MFEDRVAEKQLDISLHEPCDLRRLLARGEEGEVVAPAVAEVREARAFADNVSEAASRVSTEPTAGEGRSIYWVRDSFVLPVPAEVP